MLKTKIKIESYDVGADSRIKLSSLMKYMQQVAVDDIGACGATYENMRNDDLVFVIVKFGIVFHEPIVKNDEIEILTINNEINGIIFVREYLIYKEGRIVAEATTHWVLMSYIRRFPVRPSALKYTMPEKHLEIKGVELPKKITVSDFPESESEYIVRYSGLDENHHLNNTVYADIVCDYCGLDVKNIKSCFINFISEAVKDDSLNIRSSHSGKTAVMNAVNKRTNKICFEASITFED